MLEDERVRPLAEQYGANRVWWTFMELFGFPVTWQPNLKQLIELKSVLEEGEPHVV